MKENISGLIDSELAVKDVINQLDEASEQLNAIENWLNDYNAQLKVSFFQYIINVLLESEAIH